MTIFFRVLFALVVFVGGSFVLPAQQEGSVAIASSIRMEGDTTTHNFVSCVERLVQAGVPAKDAVKDCKEGTKIVA